MGKFLGEKEKLKTKNKKKGKKGLRNCFKK